MAYRKNGIKKILAQFIKETKKKIPIEKIILFGSYAKGTSKKYSDVDIAVEVLENESIRTMTLTVQNLGYRKQVPIQIHIFSRNKVDLNLFANIANGIVLSGFLEVRP